MNIRKILSVAVACSAPVLWGEVVDSGELDVTQKNEFWDCTQHSCPVCREGVSATIAFAGGSLVASSAETVDSWIFTTCESNACPIDSFPVGFLLFLR